MTAKTKTPSAPSDPQDIGRPWAGPWPTDASTTEERLLRIEAMGQRIHGYVQFMCQPGNLSGTSAEAKEKAVRAFYERMVHLECQLARIQEALQLE
jgi:hypothetical protein